MTDLPTLLFTNVQASRMLERWSAIEAMRALREQDRLIRASVARHDGQVVEETGDGLYALLESRLAATLAAVEAQRALRPRAQRCTSASC